jgi:hypothetical protein
MADPDGRAAVASYKRAMEDALVLAEIREQQDAARQDVDRDARRQSTITRIEREEDIYLATLRGYAATLGGQLEVTVVFPDGTVELAPIEDRSRSDVTPSPTLPSARR